MAGAVVFTVAAIAAPQAIAAGANPQVAVSSISCTAAGDCSAVSSYANAIGFGHGLLLTETNGKWSAGVQAELPANASPDPMPAVSTEIADESALAHAISLAPGLSVVRCTSPGNCVAVGSYIGTDDLSHGLIITEKNGTWQRGVEAPIADESLDGHHLVPEFALDQLACPAAGDCVALGVIQTTRGTDVPVAFTEKNGVWGRGVEIAAPASVRRTSIFSYPVALSCQSVGSCVAVGGSASDELILSPLVFTESSGTWRASTVTLPANQRTQQGAGTLLGGATLSAVSCPSTGGCTAAGEYQDTRLQEQAFAITRAGSRWSRGTEMTLPSGAAASAGYEAAEIDNIACPSAENCSAVGSYTDNDHNQQGLLLSESGGVWAPGVEAALPAPYKKTINGQFVALTGLACASAGTCVATGSYNFGSYMRPRTSLVVQESADAWSPGSNLPLPANAAHVQANIAPTVDCLPGIKPLISAFNDRSTGGCTVAGSYTNLAGQYMGMASSRADGTFAGATGLTIPGLNRTELTDSLYSVLEPPVELAAGTSEIKKAGGFTYRFTAAEKGTVRSAWYARVNGHTQLLGSLRGSVMSAGTFRERLDLTHAGQAALSGTGNVKVTGVASFSTASGIRVEKTENFTLMHWKTVSLKFKLVGEGSEIRDRRVADYLAHHAF